MDVRWMRPWCGLLLLWVAGCGVDTGRGGGDGWNSRLFDDPFGKGSGDGPVGIDALVPNEGPAGTVVEIQGWGLDDGGGQPWVTLGGETLTPTIVSDTLLEIEIPQSYVGGAVDLEISNDLGSVLAPGAFTYRGGFGAALIVEYIDYINPNQFNPPGQNYLSLFGAFLLPQIEALSPVIVGTVGADTCQLNPQQPQADVTALDVGPTVELASGASVISIPKDDPFYAPVNGTTTDLTGFISNTLYHVRADGGSGEASVPAFDIADAVGTPHDFTVNAPNLGGQFTVVSKTQNLTFGWTSDFPGEAMMITLLGYKLTGAADDGLTGNEMHCVALDDGSFTVPVASLAQLPQATHVIVLMSRRRDVDWAYSPNQESTGESLGYWTQVGALEFN